MDIYLIRHTQVEAPGICYGHSDVPLAATFPDEVARLRAQLAPVLREAGPAFTSPSARCRALAAELAPAAHPDERLREMHFGTWELRAWNELPAMETQPWMVDYVSQAPPQGETFQAVQDRAASFLQDLTLAPGTRPILVVTHGGVVRALLCHCLGIPLHKAFQLVVNYGAVIHLAYQHGQWNLHSFDSGFLPIKTQL